MRAKVNLFTSRCPHCRSIDFRAVGTRNAMEAAFHWLLQPCHCDLCGQRFFLLRWRPVVVNTA